MKIFTVDGHAWTENEIDEMLDYLTKNYDFHNFYDDFLDEEGPVKIEGREFRRSCIYKKCDPIYYHCGYANFIDSERRNFSADDQYFLDWELYPDDFSDENFSNDNFIRTFDFSHSFDAAVYEVEGKNIVLGQIFWNGEEWIGCYRVDDDDNIIERNICVRPIYRYEAENFDMENIECSDAVVDFMSEIVNARIV